MTLTTESGTMTINLGRFSVATTPDAADPVPLSTATGTMTANLDNNRMAIYTINILADGVLELVLDQQTIAND